MLIERIDDPAPEIHKAILDLIVAYNDTHTGPSAPVVTFACLARADDGAVAGGLWASAYYDWMHIDLLYLPERARRGGMGWRMMRAAEHAAARRGCKGVFLDTITFQAPGFYRKLGYEVFGQIDRYIGDNTRFALRKRGLQAGEVDTSGFETTTDPDPASRVAIARGLEAFGDAVVGPANRRSFSLVVRDEPCGPIRGGLHGRIGRGWLFIELLVLPEAARRQKLGTILMRQAEDVAKQHGVVGVHLDTFSFQARPFYERLGYRVFGEIPNFPSPHSRFFLARRLDGAPL